MRGGEVVVDGFAAKRLEPFGVNESVFKQPRIHQKNDERNFFSFLLFPPSLSDKG